MNIVFNVAPSFAGAQGNFEGEHKVRMNSLPSPQFFLCLSAIKTSGMFRWGLYDRAWKNCTFLVSLIKEQNQCQGLLGTICSPHPSRGPIAAVEVPALFLLAVSAYLLVLSDHATCGKTRKMPPLLDSSTDCKYCK